MLVNVLCIRHTSSLDNKLTIPDFKSAAGSPETVFHKESHPREWRVLARHPQCGYKYSMNHEKVNETHE